MATLDTRWKEEMQLYLGHFDGVSTVALLPTGKLIFTW
jgi:hypothetical protein